MLHCRENAYNNFSYGSSDRIPKLFLFVLPAKIRTTFLQYTIPDQTGSQKIKGKRHSQHKVALKGIFIPLEKGKLPITVKNLQNNNYCNSLP